MRSLPTVIMLCGSLAFRAAAQSFAGMEVGVVHYGGTARDTGGLGGSPGGGAMVSLRFMRQWPHWGAGLRVSYANPGLAIRMSGVSATDKTTGKLLEISPVVSTRVGGIGPSGAVRLEVGPALHLWDFDGEYRKRLGGTAALAYEWPVAGKLSGAVRLEGMLSPSWFDAADVPPEFERHATWRYGVGLGLRYRLSGG